MSVQPSLAFRPLDRSQVRAWAGLLAAVEAEDRQQIHMNEQELLEQFDDPDFDFERGSVAVYDGDAMVGYAWLIRRTEADPVHEMYQEAAVDPGHRGSGIGSMLLKWSERAAVPLHEDRFPGRPLELRASVATQNVSALRLYAENGYEQKRWFHLMRAQLGSRGSKLSAGTGAEPAGLSFTRYEETRAADAMQVKNEAFRDQWGSTEHTPEGWAHLTSSSAFRPAASFLAYSPSGEPLGVLISMEFDGDTAATGIRELYINIVGTRAAARGRGIATALLNMALEVGAFQGFERAALHVDADSPTGAVGLYERAGFSVAATSVTVAKAL